VSPGLIVHHFGDKDALLAAAFRQLSRRVREAASFRLREARSPRERLTAVIDANLAPEEFNHRTGSAWLAFWGQALHVPRLRRVQAAYQYRLLSNLRHALRPLLPFAEVAWVAGMIAALIDGVWLRAALSGWREADSATARAMLADFVAHRLPA
jgi:betaine-aldehyde dehydrogenase